MITGKILKAEESTDGRKNIAIIVEFSEDGKVIVPEWVLWMRFENFLGLSQAQVEQMIRVQIESQIGNLIRLRCQSDKNGEIIQLIEAMKKDFTVSGDTWKTTQIEAVWSPTPLAIEMKLDGTVTTK